MELSAAGLAAGDAGVWALTGDGRLARLNPRRGRLRTDGGARGAPPQHRRRPRRGMVADVDTRARRLHALPDRPGERACGGRAAGPGQSAPDSRGCRLGARAGLATRRQESVEEMLLAVDPHTVEAMTSCGSLLPARAGRCATAWCGRPTWTHTRTRTAVRRRRSDALTPVAASCSEHGRTGLDHRDVGRPERGLGLPRAQGRPRRRRGRAQRGRAGGDGEWMCPRSSRGGGGSDLPLGVARGAWCLLQQERVSPAGCGGTGLLEQSGPPDGTPQAAEPARRAHRDATPATMAPAIVTCTSDWVRARPSGSACAPRRSSQLDVTTT